MTQGRLVLSRRAGETIVLRDPLGTELAEITVVWLDGYKCRLSIKARQDILIHRRELDGRKFQARTDAGDGAPVGTDCSPGL